MSNTTGYEFNAPQFQDFLTGLDESDGADTFFDVESEVSSENKEIRLKNASTISIKTEILTPSTVNSPSSKRQINTEAECPTTPKNEKNENKENRPKNASTISIKTEILTPSTVNSPSSKLQINTEAECPTKPTTPKVSEKRRDIKRAFRRLSNINSESVPVAEVGQLATIQEKLSEDMKKLSVKTKEQTYFEGIPIEIKEEKQHAMTTRKDKASKTPTISLRTRVVNKGVEAPNRKRKSIYQSSEGTTKYMAMAESILHFQKDTPPRFHSTRRRSSGVHGNRLKARQSYNPRRTIALTPKLLTATRSRPVDIPSSEARVEIELEDMKRHQVKAMPLNEKILQPPKPIQKSDKPPTKPDPFNLSQIFKKPAPKTDAEPFKFTANPLPKDIFVKPTGIGKKRALPITIPESPVITKSMRYQKAVRVPSISNDNKMSLEDLTSFGVPCKFTAVKNTEVKPFSFETRDKEMQEKKEKKIQEILEAERKAREFKANPVPSFDAPKESIRLTRKSNLNCSKSTNVSMSEDGPLPFKARSPKVLRKAPFKPNLEHLHSQPCDIQLNTERRRAERQEFEMKQIEKEEMLAYLREQAEAEKKQKEKEEVARLRQETVHKAQPMPNFKLVPKTIKSIQPLTDPKSPQFTRRTRTTNQSSSNQ